MALFDIPKRGGKEQDIKIAKQLKKKGAPTTVKSGGLLSKIEEIRRTVGEYLGKYAKDYVIINDIDELDYYISDSIDNGIISIDTETTGLNPMIDKIVGLCLYTINQRPAYVPINHVSYITGQRIPEQLTEQEVALHLKRLESVKIIMFNAKFDIRVIRNQLGVYLTCYWDCYLASRLMNENEPNKGLKALHQKYVLDGDEDEFNYESLFKGVTADKIPIDTFYLYASHDALVTYELYNFQKDWLRLDHPREDLRNVAWVFFNIEMPCVNVVADMEDTGIELDLNYASELSETYHKLLDDSLEKFYAVLDDYSDDIDRYVRSHPNAKLDNPINIASSSQIAILLYDILGIEPVDKRSPRGTGEAILSKIDNPITKAVLEYRGISKLINTYIDKLPNCVNPNDGRIHCSFNQYGADTGRFSSSDPKLNWAYM